MKIIQNINKIGAIYLWWYSVVFILVITDLKFGFLSESIKSILARYPYQFDYELMFTVLFLVWGIFLWKNARLNKFSGYAFLTQGAVMIILGFVRQNEIMHFFLDSIFWIVLGYLLIKNTNSEDLYRCKECGLKYTEKEWTEKCEVWCKEHQSCNLEIIEHSVKKS